MQLCKYISRIIKWNINKSNLFNYYYFINYKIPDRKSTIIEKNLTKEEYD